MRRAIPEVLAFGFLLAAAVYATWPLARHASTRLPATPGDPLQNAWLLGWTAHALRTDPLRLFDANIFYPERLTLAYSENLLGVSLFGAPIFWLTGNAALAMNVVELLIYAVGAFGSYLLVKELTGYRGAGLVAGAAYGLAPYRVGSIAHVHLVATHLLPLVLLLLIRLRKRPSRRLIVALGLVLALQFLSSLTAGLITLIAVLPWAAGEVLRLRQGGLRILGRAAAGLGLGLALAAPILFPYAGVRQLHPEFRYAPQEALFYSVSPSAYLFPPERGGVAVRAGYRLLEERFEPRTAPWEKRLFPGFWLSAAFVVSVVAGAVGIVRILREPLRRFPPGLAHMGLFVGIAAAGFVITLGPRLGAQPHGMPLPFMLISSAVPGSVLRVPARFATLVVFGMAGAVGILIGSTRPPLRRWLVAGSLLALALELMPSTVRTAAIPEITAAHRRVASTRGAVLALPTIEFDSAGRPIGPTGIRESVHLYLSTAHFRPLTNGYGSFNPPSYYRLARLLQHFPSPESVRALRSRGVTTVIVQTRMIHGTPWVDVIARLERWPGIRTVAQAHGVRVYDISAASS